MKKTIVSTNWLIAAMVMMAMTVAMPAMAGNRHHNHHNHHDNVQQWQEQGASMVWQMLSTIPAHVR